MSLCTTVLEISKLRRTWHRSLIGDVLGLEEDQEQGQMNQCMLKCADFCGAWILNSAFLPSTCGNHSKITRVRNVQEIPFSVMLGGGWNTNTTHHRAEHYHAGPCAGPGGWSAGLLAPEELQSQNLLARSVVQVVATAP